MPPATAFTLTEVIIAMAIALLLLLGINHVFRTTSSTIGAGTALTEALRSHKAAFSVLEHDIHGYDIDTGLLDWSELPFLLIDSQRVAAFRDRNDMLGDNDYDPTATAADRDAQTRSFDTTGNGVDDYLTPRAIYNHRNHRIDRLAFFSEGEFFRQTSNGTEGTTDPAFSPYQAFDDPQFIARGMFSDRAYIWYGHLQAPRDTNPGHSLAARETLPPRVQQPLYAPPQNYFYPGEAIESENPNNFFASDWRLGRVAMLMREPTLEADGRHRIRDPNFEPPDPADNYPLPQWYIRRAQGAAAFSLAPFSVNSEASIDGTQVPNGVPHRRIQHSRFDLAGMRTEQYRNIVADFEVESLAGHLDYRWRNRFDYRFHTNPFPLKPYEPRDIARLSPILLENCTQFIVEYAGDFLHQNPDGSTASAGPSGTIDFNIDPVTGQPSIRWYGFPRDVNGNNQILRHQDVVPLRDYLHQIGEPPASFERMWPGMDPADTPNVMLPAPPLDYAADDSALPLGSRYMVVWSPVHFVEGNEIKPDLIRIIITVVDPRGRLQEGVTKEYVFRTR